MRPRTAFTLLELLACIVVAAVLASLLFPAIQAARGAGRRAECASQLHQIGIALEHYRGPRRSFPLAAGLPSVTPQLPILSTLLVPYLEDAETVFRCPDDGVYFQHEGLSYEYRGFGVKLGATTPILQDFDRVHAETRNLLYADGHVE